MGAYAETAPYDCPKTDDYVLPAIREYALKTAMGQSSGGTWGHGFAWTSKLPKDPTAHPPG